MLLQFLLKEDTIAIGFGKSACQNYQCLKSFLSTLLRRLHCLVRLERDDGQLHGIGKIRHVGMDFISIDLVFLWIYEIEPSLPLPEVVKDGIAYLISFLRSTDEGNGLRTTE